MISIAHANTTAPKAAFDITAWDAISQASPVVQATLAILIIMSVVSWAILLTKKKAFTQVKKEDDAFVAQFWKTSSLEAINSQVAKYPASPVARIFKAGYSELQKMATQAAAEENSEDEPQLHGSDNIERALRQAIDTEVFNLEKRLSFLATTGSTAPFIGLFGTVWGIMGSFQKIGAVKTASLAVVAPGISEALIATAVGLAAAIPAVMAYNHFLTLLRRSENVLNNFAVDYLNVIKRNFFRGE